MNANIHSRKGFLVAVSVAMLICVACSPMLFYDESDAANATATVDIKVKSGAVSYIPYNPGWQDIVQ